MYVNISHFIFRWNRRGTSCFWQLDWRTETDSSDLTQFKHSFFFFFYRPVNKVTGWALSNLVVPHLSLNSCQSINLLFREGYITSTGVPKHFFHKLEEKLRFHPEQAWSHSGREKLPSGKKTLADPN